MGLTQNLTLDCNDRRTRGGVKTLYFGDHDQLSWTFTVGAASSHDVTAITPSASMYEIQFQRDEAEVTENFNRSDNRTVVNEVSLVLNTPRMDQAKRALIQDLVDTCRLFCVAELYSGDVLLLGWDNVDKDDAYMEHTTLAYTSGRARTDANRAEITFMGMRSELVREYTGTFSDLKAP